MFDIYNIKVQVGQSNPAGAQQNPSPGVGDSNYPVWPTDWPYDPNHPIPQIPSNPNESIDQQIQDIEAYMKYLADNPNDPTTYNGALAMLHALMNLGQEISTLSPADQAKYNAMLKPLEDSGLFSTILRTVMMGAFYQNGANGFDKTNQFIDSLMQQFGGLSNVSPFFSGLASIAQIEDQFVKSCETNPAYEYTDPNNGAVYLTDGHGNIMDFNSYLFSATTGLSLAIQLNGINQAQQAVNAWYANQAETLCEKYKNNPDLLVMLLLQLMGQKDNDYTKDINGFGNQENNLSAQQKIIINMLNLLKDNSSFQGPNGPDNAKDFISQLNQLKQEIDTFDPELSSSFDGIYNTIMSGNVTIPFIGNRGATNTLDNDTIFNFPPQSAFGGASVWYLPPATPQNPNPQPQQIPYGQKVTLPKGTQIWIGAYPSNAPSTTVPLSALCAFEGSFTSGGSTIEVYNSIADWGDVANYLNGLFGNPNNSLLQELMSGQSLLNGLGPMLQQQTQNTMNIKNSLEGMLSDGLSMFTDLEKSINQAMQQANA